MNPRARHLAHRPSPSTSTGHPAVAIVSTYPPRRCGIAAFSQDLRTAIRKADPSVVEVVALDDEPRSFPDEVSQRLSPGDVAASRLAADRLGRARVDAVLLQHEFGIYGGRDGEYVLELVERLDVPVITTLHTILADPSPRQRMIINALGRGSARLVVMSESAAERLGTVYAVDPTRIRVIPHGVPDVPDIEPGLAKRMLGRPADRPLILSFGLLGPGKGYELAIDAMASVVAAVPDARYVILGSTHPDQRRAAGESYRERLIERAARLGISDSVDFVDAYVEPAALVRWLQATDVYVTPYPGAEQIVSGTLAYALGAGRAIVSTPFSYARELLADGRGALIPFADAPAMAAAVVGFLKDDSLRAATGRRAYAYGHAMRWDAVGRAYADLIAEVASHGERPSAAPRSSTDDPTEALHAVSDAG